MVVANVGLSPLPVSNWETVVIFVKMMCPLRVSRSTAGTWIRGRFSAVFGSSFLFLEIMKIIS